MAIKNYRDDEDWSVGQTAPFQEFLVTEADGNTVRNLTNYAAECDFAYRNEPVHATRQALIHDAANGLVWVILEGDEAFKVGVLEMQLTLRDPGTLEKTTMIWGTISGPLMTRNVL